MTNLFSHIEYLLLSHDCVIVPRLGAFIVITSPAELDCENEIILPPSRGVMFNQAVASDDGLLANSIVRRSHISFEEARKIIMRETSQIKTNLNTNKEIKAGSLGSLRLGDEGNIIFTPSADTNEANAKLGYLPLNLTKEEENNEKQEAESVITKEEHAHAVAGLFRLHKTFSKVAVAFSILAAFVIAFILYPIPVDKREQRASVIPVPVKTSTPSVPTVKEIPAAIAVDTTQIPAPLEETISEVSLPNHYLIVGTFKTDTEAKTYMAAHSKDADMQIVESTKVTRVAVAASDNIEELKKLLNSKDIHAKYPNAWIWSRK
ncbi:MAG: hypothetical protein HDR88_00875 [Bacteroides sp.]|nr:hypothetical protein [Bacteroides sp.]